MQYRFAFAPESPAEQFFMSQLKPLVFIFSAFCLLLFSAPPASAQSQKSGKKHWRELREEIFAELELELARLSAQQVGELEAAQSLGLALPLPANTKSKELVFEESRQEAEKLVLSRHPRKSLQELVMLAELRYPIYKIGEQVNIRLKTKSQPYVSGTLQSIGDERVQIGSRFIPIRDIVTEQQRGFDHFISLKDRQNYVEKQKNLQEAIIKNALADSLPRVFAARMLQEGYYYDEEKHNDKMKLENWCKAELALQEELARLRQETAIKMRPELEKQRFGEHNFKYYSGKKEWRPAGLWQRVKNIFD